MLIINAAPIDQSGRTLSLAKHLAQQNIAVTIAAYKGTRKPEKMHPNIKCVFIKQISTESSWIFLRWFWLGVKMAYLSLVSVWLILKEHHWSQSALKECKEVYLLHHLDSPSVICVAPPSPTIVLPLVYARVLGMRVAVDWHRVASGVMETFNLIVARYVANITVTQSMEKYFRARGITNIRTVSDLYLMEILEKRVAGSKPQRAEFFAYLEKKYPEYTLKIRGMNLADRIGVCSTSYSEEEDMEGLLRAVDACSVSGTLIITTKKPVVHAHLCISVVQMFLDYEDYLKLLQMADFGISTHMCSYDFPMKIVDYIRCGLPVIAHESTLYTCPAPYTEYLKLYKYFIDLGELLQKQYIHTDSKHKHRK
ncbi:beta-1,4-mannosyltransferase [Nematocida sp. AWRm77]|nr:beta-1,4-mannosyltransferase [Nematocida sp. AWRm77]